MRSWFRPAVRIAVAVAACALVAACGGRPTGFLTSAGAIGLPVGAHRVDMLVATTRAARDAKPGEMFTGERGPALAFADIAISIPPDGARQIGEVQWPSALPGDPARDFVTLSADRVDLKGALARFDRRIARVAGRRALVFVHGYNTRFEEAVYRFAQIAHDSGANVLPVLFTWPSRGQLLAYGYDRESANYSRSALEAVLQSLANDRSVGEITVLAHSMGNWVTVEALHQMAMRHGRVAPKIANIILAAPDVDFDVFREDIEGMGPHRPPITLFVSRDDNALAFSRRLWGDEARVGAIDPNAEPYKSDFAKQGISVVDLSDVKTDDPTNHSKFARSPEVVQMIGRRLAAGQTLTDAHGGLGEKIGVMTAGAASAIGDAAGVVISTPIAVVDPETRDTLGQRMKRVGSDLGDTLRSAADVVPGRR